MSQPISNGWDELREMIELLHAARVYLDHFVDQDAALIDGFDVDEWCRRADALTFLAAQERRKRAV